MPSRQFHHKSRHGCVQCKAKKLKCDAQRPCGRCLKRQIPCGVSESLRLAGSPKLVYDLSLVNVEHSSSDLGVQDLELLHHYQNWVCCTLSGYPPVQQTWQSAIPKEATAHPGLMHGILALAALHRSHVDSNGHSRYRSAAMGHQNLSLPYLRSLINNACEENCNALFALSTFAVVFAFGVSQSPGADMNLEPFNEMIRLIELVKGVLAVAEVTRHWLLQGPLRPLLAPGIWEIRLMVPREIGEALNRLIQRNDTLIQSGQERETYGTAIKMLRQTFEILCLNPSDHSHCLIWVALIERGYIELLRAGEPMALVILAHFGVALNASRRNWWLGDWGRQLVQTVHDMLDDEWRTWIQWPSVSVGILTDLAMADPGIVPFSAFQYLVDHPKIPIDRSSFPYPSKLSCDKIGSLTTHIR